VKAYTITVDVDGGSRSVLVIGAKNVTAAMEKACRAESVRGTAVVCIRADTVDRVIKCGKKKAKKKGG